MFHFETQAEYESGLIKEIKQDDLNNVEMENYIIQTQLNDATPTPLSEDFCAQIFSDLYQNKLKYDPFIGWFEYNGKRWEAIKDVITMGYARRICRKIASDVKEKDPKIQEGLLRKITSAQFAANVVRLSCSDPRQLVNDVWNKNPWLLNTPNGTVDLRTSEVQNHKPEDYITRITNASPSSHAPIWNDFLNRIFSGNTNLISFLQNYIGYCLTGITKEEKLLYLHGLGANGKSTFLEILTFVFGNYGAVTAPETLLYSRNERHSTEIARLDGPRLVTFSELNEGQCWHEPRIKQLTGSDTITARYMRKDFFEFKPQFKLVGAGNHKPTLRNVNEAIKRRFVLIPFDVTIPPNERDLELKEKLRAEADGILGWGIVGCLNWQREGLDPPENVTVATEEYLLSEDVFVQWIEECCTNSKNVFERTGLLYQSFSAWKVARGEKPLSQKNFSTTLADRGFKPDRTSKARIYRGICLNDFEAQRIKEVANGSSFPKCANQNNDR